MYSKQDMLSMGRQSFNRGLWVGMVGVGIGAILIMGVIVNIIA